MNNVTLYNASAGSGKTHSISEEISTRIQKGLDPERIIATTFTIKAAEELKERIRKDLIKKGMFDSAIRINSALIGTVNSIGGKLLEKYSLMAGLPPSLSVIDDNFASQAMKQIIGKHLSDDFLQLVDRLEQNEEQKFSKDIYKIASAIRANDMDAAQIQKSLSNSLKEIEKVYGKRDVNNKWQNKISILEKPLRLFFANAELDPELKPIPPAKRKAGYKDLQGIIDNWKEFSRLLDSNQEISWKKRFKLLETPLLPALYQADFLNIHAQYYPLFTCAEFHDDLKNYFEAVFRIANDSVSEFADWKAERGLVDFTDQEQKLYRLIKENTFIQEDIKASFDLLLVDEFQDTNPIQLALFIELNKGIKETVWVGDSKQSIYGFRGADINLMQSVVNEIDKGIDGNISKVLDISWRSRKELVHLSNAVFLDPFVLRHTMKPERICLNVSQSRKVTPNNLGSPFQLWKIELPEAAKLSERFYDIMANKIKDVITKENYVVIKGKEEQGETRRLKGGDIALLFHKNDHCGEMSQALVRLGIKVCSHSTGLFSKPEVILLLAALNILEDRNNNLARAELMLLETFDGSQEEMIQSRLNYLKGEKTSDWGDKESVMISNLASKGNNTKDLSLLNKAIWACGIIDIQRFIYSWNNPGQRSANIDQLLVFIKQFEDSCTVSGQIADIYGFMSFSNSLVEDEKDSLGVFSDENTVNVSTIHASKGLEWPFVVVNDITYQYDYGKYFFGVHVDSIGDFNVDDPLKNREIRYYLKPTALDIEKHVEEVSSDDLRIKWAPKVKGEVKEDIVRQDIKSKYSNYADFQNKEIQENLRKFYVAFTRARDYLALSYSEYFKHTFFELIGDITTGCSYTALNDTWCVKQTHGLNPTDLIDTFLKEKKGVTVDCEILGIAQALPIDINKALPKYFSKDPEENQHLPLYVFPSEKGKSDIILQAKLIQSFSKKITLLKKVSSDISAELGNCVHYALASLSVHPSEKWLDIATRQIASSGMTDYIDPKNVVDYSLELFKWMNLDDVQYYYPELPVKYLNNKSQIVSGSIDLYIEKKNEVLIIDHKTFNPSEQIKEESLATLVVSRFGSQMMAYKDIMEAAGKQSVKMLIHLPMHGKIFELSL